MNKYTLSEFISESDIQAKVKALGERITEDYKDKDLLIVGILKGSVIFMSDLARHIDLPLEMTFMSVSSYASGVATSGSVRLLCDLDKPLRGKDVLIIEDIIDSGYTISYLVETLNVRQPNSLKICALLDKPSRRMANIAADYTGFEIEDEFVVGYGLDYAGKHRNLGHIAKVVFE